MFWLTAELAYVKYVHMCVFSNWVYECHDFSYNENGQEENNKPPQKISFLPNTGRKN